MSFHILDDHVDTIVVRPVVALLFHNFGKFLVRLAEVGVIDDASFDVSWAGDKLFKFLLGKESAEGVLLSEAVVDIAYQESSLVVVEELLKVMHDWGEGLVTWSVNWDDVQVLKTDLHHLQMSAVMMVCVLNSESSSHVHDYALAAALAQEEAVVAV